jgi:3-deoxy-D-manno-octulosonate 8-phosphate phosphatase (KDO 8-P phosphatase)
MEGNKPALRDLARIRAIAFDFDGVLTDGGMWWGPGEEEWKRVCFADIMGVSLARRAGIAVGLISGENSSIVDRYAQKLLITHVTKGCRDKAAAVRAFAEATQVDLRDVCFMGDDINDIPAMRITGFSAAPGNANDAVLACADFISPKTGGNGAARELIEMLLEARGVKPLDLFLSHQ